MTARKILAAVVVLVAARIALAVMLWEPGYSALTWDDFSRVAIAQAWAENPYLIADLVWLPLPTWINGAAFAVFGGSFLTNPMALTAMVNTTAVILAALLTTLTSWRVAKSYSGSAIVLAAALFAPWGLFVGGAGLAEPLYYLALASVGYHLVAWVQSGRLRNLGLGSASIAAACAMRYEGWWLAVAWLALVTFDTLRARDGTSRMASLLRAWPRVALAASPLLIPAWWMAVNYVMTGSPLFFARRSAEIFLGAYGADLFRNLLGRTAYYPSGLVKAGPMVLGFTLWVLWTRRARLEVRALARLFGLAFALFYVTSVASPAVGGFPERFLFAFVLGMMPLLGLLPGVLSEVVPRPWRAVVAGSLTLLAIVFTTVRVSNPPEEWTHAPDLLLLTEVLEDLGPVEVALGPAMAEDAVPIDIRNGSDTDLVPLDDPGMDLQLERNPARLIALGLADVPSVGRYHVYGPEAPRLTVAPCPGCDGWTWIDETGVARPVSGSGFLWLEFITDDPQPGQFVSLTRVVPGDSSGHLDLRWLYGHGFNPGRMRVEVSLDGRILFSTDISEPSAWTRVRFRTPPGEPGSTLVVSVTALDGIEEGWLWGRASTVLIREMVVAAE